MSRRYSGTAPHPVAPFVQRPNIAIMPIDKDDLLSALVAAVRARVLVFDANGTCTQALEAEDADLVGANIEHILPPRIAQRLGGVMRHSLEESIGHLLEYRIPSNGDKSRDRWIEARISPISKTRVLCLFEDISARKYLEEDIEHATLIDPLTEISNQRHFMRVLDQEITRQGRYREPFCLMLLEVEHYDTVREAYGDEIGDQCVQDVARLIRQQLRHSDVLARLEGAEFGVLLLNTTLSAAREVAERIRARIAATPFAIAGRTLRLTITGGVTALRTGDTASSLLWRSEEALFKSERSGQSGIHVG